MFRKTKNIEIGIAGESRSDVEIARFYSHNLVSQKGFRAHVSLKNRYINNTQIHDGDLKKIASFFNTNVKDRPDLIVIITDRDNDKNLEKELNLGMQKAQFPCPVVLAIPEEKIEDWVISDVGALNKILRPKVEIKTPRHGSRGFDAKNWLALMIKSHKPGFDSDRLMLEIANVSKTVRSESFKRFSGDFMRIFKTLIENETSTLVPKKQRGKINKKIRYLAKIHPRLPKDIRRRN